MGTRVLSIPAGHAYVRHALGGSERIDVLPDPPVPHAAHGEWWPHQGMDVRWLSQHADAIDLVHVHFGFEHRAPAELEEWVATLHRLRLPLVVTVHDLTLPHAADQAAHRERLGVLVGAADALLTLTRGAAQQIQSTWGREATVLHHPHVVPLRRMLQVRPPLERPVTVGMHVKSARANCGGLDLLEPLSRIVQEHDDWRLTLHTHHDLSEDPTWRAALERAGEQPSVRVHWIDPMSDDELWDHLESLDVSVLPHRWGTHTGWGEACRDLGTGVVAPDVGHLAEQLGTLTYRWRTDGVHDVSLRAALDRAVVEAAGARTSRRVRQRIGWRAAERARVVAGHERVYADVRADGGHG